MAELSVTVHVSNTLAPGVSLCSQFNISTSDIDTNYSNNAKQSCLASQAPTYDVEIAKSLYAGRPAAAEILTYRLNYSSNGNRAATNVRITDTLPAEMTYDPSYSTYGDSGWTRIVSGNQVILTRPAVDAYDNGSVYVSGRIADNVSAGVPLTNTARIATSNAETNYSNNQAQHSVAACRAMGRARCLWLHVQRRHHARWSCLRFDRCYESDPIAAGCGRCLRRPVTLGFAFPYYQNTYTQTFFSTNGLMTFGSGDDSYGIGLFLALAVPVTCWPSWDDLQVMAPQAVYYKQGGTAPYRYFVVEWQNVSRRGVTGNPLTFEAILYENGTIVFQYLSLTAPWTTIQSDPEQHRD